jgi:hypothetical protein
MKAKLIKTPEQLYKLEFYNDEDVLACATALLSKQNCDEIFGVVDVEKLAEEEFDKPYIVDMGTDITPAYQDGFKIGFNKAMELNKDKVFTLEDMRMAYDKGRYSDKVTQNGKDIEFNSFIQSLQQPTEIEVEILMQCIDPNCDSLNRKGCCIPGDKPRINAEGYLTLKKI